MLIQLLLLLMLAWSIILAIVVFYKWYCEDEVEQALEKKFKATLEK